MEKVEMPTTPCIPWSGKGREKGYGKWWGRRNGQKARSHPAHRIAYENAKGPIPEGLQIDHLCRNRACVNPDHLEAVTGRVNVLRGMNPPAQNARKTHCVRGHEFTPENTRMDRGYRFCLKCAERRRIVRYIACPDCTRDSIGVQGDGRIVRHSFGFGGVDKVGWTIICTGSGKHP